MNIPGIDEGVKQALIKRTTFQSNDGPRKRPSRASSAASSSVSGKKSELDVRSDFLVIPGSSNV